MALGAPQGFQAMAADMNVRAVLAEGLESSLSFGCLFGRVAAGSSFGPVGPCLGSQTPGFPSWTISSGAV